MSSKITIDELEKYLWGSAVLLRTHVDAGAYKQYIFPLLFFKRLSDVYDEECEKVRAEFGEEALDWEENHQFQIPDGAHWNDVRNRRMLVKLLLKLSIRLKLQILRSFMVSLVTHLGLIRIVYRTDF